MARVTAQDRLAQQIRDLLPTIVTHSDESGRELVQTTVWLVGLATGFLALMSAKPDVIAKMGRLGPYLTGALLGVIVVGVAQRLTHQLAIARERLLLYAVQMQFWGITADLDDPIELQEWWDEAKILENILTYFELDYSFLRTHAAPLATYQESYRTQYHLWREGEKRKQQRLAAIVGALEGKTPMATVDIPPEPKSDEADHLADIRVKARRVRRTYTVRNALYWVTGGLFMVSAVLLAVSLL